MALTACLGLKQCGTVKSSCTDLLMRYPRLDLPCLSELVNCCFRRFDINYESVAPKYSKKSFHARKLEMEIGVGKGFPSTRSHFQLLVTWFCSIWSYCRHTASTQLLLHSRQTLHSRHCTLHKWPACAINSGSPRTVHGWLVTRNDRFSNWSIHLA